MYTSKVADEDSWSKTKAKKHAEFQEHVGDYNSQVEHYMPPTFPLVPIVTPRSMQLCTESWHEIIKEQEQTNEIGMTIKISGMTLFYTEFYELLDRLDPSGMFDAVLSAHSGGQNKIAAKGSILIRIVQYALNLDFSNSKQVEFQLLMLGRAHCQKAIRPWMYSIFIQCFLNSIGSRLGSKATSDVMGGWVNLFAFILRRMIPHAIKGKIVETEFNAVVTQDVMNEDVTNQINDAEEEKDMRKKFEKASSSVHSRSQNGSRSASRTNLSTMKSPPLTRIPSSTSTN